MADKTNIQFGVRPFKKTRTYMAGSFIGGSGGATPVAEYFGGTYNLAMIRIGYFFGYDGYHWMTDILPKDWDGGTITYRVYWTSLDATSGSAKFSLSGRAFADSDTVDQAMGTAIDLDDTFLTAGDIHITAESNAVTIAGSPTGGQLIQFKFGREGTSDTIDGDVYFLGLEIQYTVTKLDED